MANPEHITQSACVAWFRYAHPRLSNLLFAVPNGAKRSRWEAIYAKQEGLTPGVSDLILLIPSGQFHGLCIEMKKEVWELGKGGNAKMKRGYQSPEQREWQKAVEAQGYRYEICRSVDDFAELIENYLDDKAPKVILDSDKE